MDLSICPVRFSGVDNCREEGRPERSGRVRVVVGTLISLVSLVLACRLSETVKHVYSSATAVEELLMSVLLSRVCLKQNLSLLELEQQLSWIRAEVEADSDRSLSRYLLADDEDALADQVRRSAALGQEEVKLPAVTLFLSRAQACELTENDVMTIRLLNETRDMLDR